MERAMGINRQASYLVQFRFRASAPEGTLMPIGNGFSKESTIQRGAAKILERERADSLRVGLSLCLFRGFGPTLDQNACFL
jgi:hypothetical protein